MFPFANKAFAQVLTQEDFGITGRIGALYNFYNFFVLAFNLCFWIGGGLILVAMLWALAQLAYNASLKADTDTVEVFRGGMKKILMIAFLGIVLLSLSGIFNFVGSSLGASISVRLPVELDFDLWN